MTETTTTRGDYRVRVVQDTDAQAPESEEWEVPVLKALLRTAGDWTFEAYNKQAEPFAAQMTELYQEEGSFTAAMDRMRETCDSLHYAEYGPNQATDYRYIAFDTRSFRDEVDLPHELTEGYANTAEMHLEEIQAWVEGDCWGWELEKRRTFTTVFDDNGQAVSGEIWEQVDATYGYYGGEYVGNAATVALAAALNKEK